MRSPLIVLLGISVVIIVGLTSLYNLHRWQLEGATRGACISASVAGSAPFAEARDTASFAQAQSVFDKNAPRGRHARLFIQSLDSGYHCTGVMDSAFVGGDDETFSVSIPEMGWDGKFIEMD